MKKRFYLIKALFCIAILVSGQSENCMGQLPRFFGPTKMIVKLDPLSNIPEADIPFDRYFYIRKYVPKSQDMPTTVAFYEIDKKGRPVFRTIIDNPYAVITGEIFESTEDPAKPEIPGFRAIDILVSPLRPNRNYSINVFSGMKKDRLKSYAEALYFLIISNPTRAKFMIDSINLAKQSINDDREVSKKELERYLKVNLQHISGDKKLLKQSSTVIIESLLAEIINQKPIISPDIEEQTGEKVNSLIFQDNNPSTSIISQSLTLESRAGVWIQPDFGLIYYGIGSEETTKLGVAKGFGGVTPYVGISILSRPYDADIPLHFVRRFNKCLFFRRFSLQIGLTMTTLAKSGYRANTFGAFNPIIGVGYRLSSSVKVHAGTVIYEKLSNNPITDNSAYKGTGYVGLSIDLRLREGLKDLGKLLVPAK